MGSFKKYNNLVIFSISFRRGNFKIAIEKCNAIFYNNENLSDFISPTPFTPSLDIGFLSFLSCSTCNVKHFTFVVLRCFEDFSQKNSLEEWKHDVATFLLVLAKIHQLLYFFILLFITIRTSSCALSRKLFRKAKSSQLKGIN